MAKRKTVKPIDLSKAIKEVLDKYGDDVYKVLDESVQEVSDESVKRLQSVTTWAKSVPGSEYSASWCVDDEKVGRLGIKRIVHNEDHYRLAHLLEKGHVSKNGTGRTFSTDKAPVRAYPHIAPVNDWAVAELPKLVEEKLSKV